MKVVARRAVYHHRRLNELDPDFDDCPEACDDEKGRDGYCADCPVAELQREFREAAEEEVAGKCPPESRAWSFNSLYADCVAALNADARLEGKGYPVGCSAIEAAAIDVVRAARFKAERIERWNKDQAAKNKS